MTEETLTPEIALGWIEQGVPPCQEINDRFGLNDFMRSPQSLDEAAVERHFKKRLEKLTPPAVINTPEGRAELRAWMAVQMARDIYINRIGFAIPCREAITAIAISPRLLEVGAGTGFWSCLLAKAGVDVVATDKQAGEHEEWHGRYHPVEKLSAGAALRAYPDRDVLVCWPTLGETWARRLAEAMQPGQVLHVISEECCAEHGFYAVLHHQFEVLDRVGLPNWEYMHDDLIVYRKLPHEQQRQKRKRNTVPQKRQAS